MVARLKTKYIYKICKQTEWNKALKEGVFKGSRIDILDGFIHLSKKNQINSTLNKYFLNQKKLVLLKISCENLKKLTYEKSSNNKVYPHLYSNLNIKSVMEVKKIDN